LFSKTEGSCEELIAEVARVSSDKSTEEKRKAYIKLMRYLMKNAHWSPFQFFDFTVEIVTTRDIATQIIRHRSFDFQQYSMRYGDKVSFIMPELRKQAETNRQSSSDIIYPTLYLMDYPLTDNPDNPVKYTLDADGEMDANTALWIHLIRAQHLYETLLEKGVAKECARGVLPGCLTTVLYVKGNLRSWLHFLLVRMDEHTQKEHREIANSVYNILKPFAPNIFEAFDEYYLKPKNII
jgi:thymidylate synthase (FAD)